MSVAADAENVSLEGMVADMRALCDREGLDVLEPIHVDDGRSGGRRDRDEFTAWLDDARSGRAQVLVNPHTDRLTREGLNVAAAILDVVEGKDPTTGREAHRPVRLVDCKGLDSAHGDAFRFRFVIQAEVGRSERERIRERSRDRARRLRRAGRWGGGTPPFGYRAVPSPDGPGWVLVVEPDEAALVRDAADALLRPDPDSLNRIARRWNHAGIKPRRADQWSRQVLTRLLTSDVIQGRAVEHGRPLRDADGTIIAPWPPVLTPGQVDALRVALAPKPDRPVQGGRRPVRLMSGLLTCSGCGATMQVYRRKPRRDGADPVVGYRCVSRQHGKLCERSASINAPLVEAHLADLYLGAVGRFPMYVERTVVTGASELAEVEADIRDVLADLATSADADMFARLQKLQARRDELADVEPERRVEVVPTGRTTAEHWAEAMTDDRREMLANAFASLVVAPGRQGTKGLDTSRLTIVWRDGDPDPEHD